MAEQRAFNPLVQGSNPWGRTMAYLERREPDWIPSAPIVVRQVRTIGASSHTVWGLIADHEAWPNWFPALDKIEVAGAASGVGGRRVATVGPRAIGEVFTAWEPDRRFAFAVIDGPGFLEALAESIEIEADDDRSCTVTYLQGFEPRRGFGWLVRGLQSRLTTELGKGIDGLVRAAQAA